MADEPASKEQAFNSGESLGPGSVQANSSGNEKDAECTNAMSSQENKQQDKAVVHEKVLSDVAGEQKEGKGNNEESGEEENGTKVEDWMVVDEDDDEDDEKMDKDEEGQQDKGERKLLASITVNIGPLRMEDLDSFKLRDVLNYSKGYTLSFEKKEEGLISKEKEKARHEGYAKIPYAFYHDVYLIKTYNKLRNLRINNRDLSVTFPEEFIKITEESATRIRLRQEKRKKLKELRRIDVETRKKSLFAHNIPPNVKEETLKTAFTGCTKVIIPKNSKEISMGFAVLQFDNMEGMTNCFKLHETDMVEIENHKIRLNKISLKLPPNDKSQNKGNQQRGNQARSDQRGNRGRNQQRGNQRGRNRQRGNRRRGNQQQNRQRNDRSRDHQARLRNSMVRRLSPPNISNIRNIIQMPPSLMDSIVTWPRFDNDRGAIGSDYGRYDNDRGAIGSDYSRYDSRGREEIRGYSPKRSRSPLDERDWKRFRGESSYDRIDDSRHRGETKLGYTSAGWGGPTDNARSSSKPEGETETTLLYLKQQLADMEKKLVHSLSVPPVAPVSSSGRSYGSGYGSGGHIGGVGAAAGGYSSATRASGYGESSSSVRSGVAYPSVGYTSGSYSPSGYASGSLPSGGYGYGSGGHTSADSLLTSYPLGYSTGSQYRSAGTSSRIEDAYNKFSRPGSML